MSPSSRRYHAMWMPCLLSSSSAEGNRNCLRCVAYSSAPGTAAPICTVTARLPQGFASPAQSLPSLRESDGSCDDAGTQKQARLAGYAQSQGQELELHDLSRGRRDRAAALEGSSGRMANVAAAMACSRSRAFPLSIICDPRRRFGAGLVLQSIGLAE